MKKIFLIWLILSVGILGQTSKTGVLSGYVYEASNGEGLIGANVFIEKLGVGASANLNGFFSLPNIPIGEHTVTISFIGYKPQKIKTKITADDNKILKVYLETDVIQSSEVVVVDSIRISDKLYSKPVSKIEMTSQQINSIPRVVEADLLRSLQTLPGVQSLSDFSSALYIRGGTPDQNLYLIDGADVYNPEHAFGLFSTFNTNAIKKAELSKGGFSADYGGRLSSVLNVINLDGNRNNFQGDVSISLLAASTTLQAPLGSFGSISASFRRTYLDQTIAKVMDDIPSYYFLDGNVKAFLDISDKDKVVISFYGGEDDLDYQFDADKPESPHFKYRWGNVTGSVNWRRILTPKLFANFWITGSRFSSDMSLDEIDLREENEIGDITAKTALEYYFSSSLNFKFGFEYKNLGGKYLEEFPGGIVDISQFRNHYISYFTGNWQPSDRFGVEAGLRYDYFNGPKDFQDFSPRATLRYRLNETSNLKLSTGIYRQYLNRIPRMFMASIWTTVDDNSESSRSVHYILGYQKELFRIYSLEIEGYYKDYKNVYSFNQTLVTDVVPTRFTEDNVPVYGSTRGILQRGDGYSYGAEILLRKEYGAISGWLGYSLSFTENKVDGLNRQNYFAPRHDRTHTVNSVFNVDLNNFFNELSGNSESQGPSKWILGLNFIYSTGQPITIPGSVYNIKPIPDWEYPRDISLYPTELNTVRLPAYFRADLSITYEKKYSWGTIAPYIQVYNVSNRKNVWFINYDYEINNNQVSSEIEYFNMLPILPSIGINIKF
jgi:hypothetical protein